MRFFKRKPKPNPRWEAKFVSHDGVHYRTITGRFPSEAEARLVLDARHAEQFQDEYPYQLEHLKEVP